MRFKIRIQDSGFGIVGRIVDSVEIPPFCLEGGESSTESTIPWDPGFGVQYFRSDSDSGRDPEVSIAWCGSS